MDWFKRKNGDAAGGEVSLSKCATYDEHNMTLEQLAARYPNSYIDLEHPAKSRGLNTNVAKARLAEDGPVRVQSPHT
jgi:hypothetical protein